MPKEPKTLKDAQKKLFEIMIIIALESVIGIRYKNSIIKKAFDEFVDQITSHTKAVCFAIICQK